MAYQVIIHVLFQFCYLLIQVSQ